LKKINPKIIYAKGSGRPEGAGGRTGGFDAGSFWSRGSVAHMLSEPGKPPIMQRAAFGDTIGATSSPAVSPPRCIIARRPAGARWSMCHCSHRVWLMAPDIPGRVAARHDLPHNDRSRAPNPLMNTYLCKDNTWLMLMMLTPGATGRSSARPSSAKICSPPTR